MASLVLLLTGDRADNAAHDSTAQCCEAEALITETKSQASEM